MKLTINIFGGPGVGKSTIAAGLFFRMKCKHYDVELVTEYAKDLVYQGRFDVLANDQLKILAEQHSRLRYTMEHRDVAIVDSPLLLSQIYFNAETNIIDSHLFAPVVINLFQKYNHFNVYLERNLSYSYEAEGRLQKTVEEAQEIDNKVKNFIVKNSITFTSVLASPTAVEIIFDRVSKFCQPRFKHADPK